MRFIRVVAVLGVLAGCNSGTMSPNGGAGAPGANGAAGTTVPGTVTSDIVSVPVAIDGAGTMPFVVDTGSPLTLIDPTRFQTLGLSMGSDVVTTLTVGSLQFMNVTVLAASPCGLMTCSTSAPAGLLGGDILGQFLLTLDYVTPAVGFNSTALPSGLGAPAATAFSLEGGGLVQISGGGTVMVPATRISVDVAIEGATYPFVVDTGSSQVLLSSDFYDMVVSDGRSQSTANVLTVNGTMTEPTTELKTVSLAGAAQTNVSAVRSPFSLDPLSAEVGHPVLGLLGGSYLSAYLITIDYPNRQITLRTHD